MNSRNLLPPLLNFSKCATALAAILSVQALASGAETALPSLIQGAMTFRASFDGDVNADKAMGDPKLYWATSMNKRQEAQPGLPPSGETLLEKQGGVKGGALRFMKKKAPTVFFRAPKNVPYVTTNWSGTVSFWLQVDPPGQLEPGFCDPIQITPRAWNDAAFFVEFEKKKDSIPFRLGIYPDIKVWNPNNRDWNSIPMAEKPLLTVEKPPFAGGKWTHVLYTFEHFNTGKPNGMARLYLDGKEAGHLPARQQTFTWDVDQAAIMLGLSYIGLLDELAIFDRPLDANEVAELHKLTSRGL